jgi:hypothetical protein
LLDVNEITDVKAELQAYGIFNYASDAAFITALTKCCSDVMREKMLNVMQSGTYTYFQTLGKAGMSVDEVNVYWAEVYYTVSYFYKMRDRLDRSARVGNTESKSEGGISRTNSGYSGKAAVALEYSQRADSCLERAGFNMQAKLKVRGSIHA